MIIIYDLDSCEKIIQETIPDTRRIGARTAIQLQLTAPMLTLQPACMGARGNRSPLSHHRPTIPVRHFFRDR